MGTLLLIPRMLMRFDVVVVGCAHQPGFETWYLHPKKKNLAVLAGLDCCVAGPGYGCWPKFDLALVSMARVRSCFLDWSHTVPS